MKDFIHTFLEAKHRRYLQRVMDIRQGASSKISYRRITVKESAGCELVVGGHSLIDASIVFERANSKVMIGSNTFMGGSTLSCAGEIDIGDNVQIAWGSIFFDHNSHSLNYIDRRVDLPNTFKGKKDWSTVDVGRLRIGNDAWIGANCVLLRGVAVGDGAVIGAGSIVTKDVPPYSFAAGNPCRVIKRLDS